MSDLTPMEWVIAEMVTRGLRNVDIAAEIGTSEYVVKNKMRRIFNKLGFWNRTEVALWYVRQTFRREDCK